jgi:hypothetical protein
MEPSSKVKDLILDLSYNKWHICKRNYFRIIVTSSFEHVI